MVAAQGALLGRSFHAALDLEVTVDALICLLGLAKAEKSPPVPAPVNQEAKKHTRSLKDPWTAELLRLKTECREATRCGSGFGNLDWAEVCLRKEVRVYALPS